MASLLLLDEKGVTRRSFKVFKGITTLGKDPESDILLDDPSVSRYHAHILKEKSGYTMISLDPRITFAINGEQTERRELRDGDVISVGRAMLRFVAGDEEKPHSGLDYTRRLYEFSEALMRVYSLDDLLVSFMDSIIELTKAQRGYLILSEGNGFAVKVARSSLRKDIKEGLLELSDTVVSWVLKEKRPLIVSDALKDDGFRHAESIVNLKLRSVMGVPLLVRGNNLGMIYLGNDRAASLFTSADLEVLTIFASQAALILDNAILLNDLKMKYDGLVKRVEDAKFGSLLGTSPAMQKVFRTLDKISSSDSSLLVMGETGTGKDLLCREIHRRSGRPGPLVKVDCSSLSLDIFREEFFGSTGKSSRISEAKDGTLIFKEISSLPLSLQAQVLQILEECKTVRFLAISSVDLEKEREKGNFRDELYYRIGHFIIKLPPLREREEDIELLARFFLHEISRTMGFEKKDFTEEAVSAMLRYSWPGNIMEMENKVRRAIVLSRGPVVTEGDLEIRPEDFEPLPQLANAKENFEKAYIEKVLRYHHGDKEKTARVLGVNVRTIYRYLGKGG